MLETQQPPNPALSREGRGSPLELATAFLLPLREKDRMRGNAVRASTPVREGDTARAPLRSFSGKRKGCASMVNGSLPRRTEPKSKSRDG